MTDEQAKQNPKGYALTFPQSSGGNASVRLVKGEETLAFKDGKGPVPDLLVFGGSNGKPVCIPVELDPAKKTLTIAKGTFMYDATHPSSRELLFSKPIATFSKDVVITDVAYAHDRSSPSKPNLYFNGNEYHSCIDINSRMSVFRQTMAEGLPGHSRVLMADPLASLKQLGEVANQAEAVVSGGLRTTLSAFAQKAR